MPTRSARPLRYAAAVAFWLVAWQAAAVAVGQRVLLVGPVEVGRRLVELALTADFWLAVGLTTGRVLLGFVLAAAVGVLTAAGSASYVWFAVLIGQALSAIRSTPVVSFIILVLIWSDSARLTTIVSFLMAVPIVHATVLTGIGQRDRQLLEMARVFRVGRWRRVLAVDVPLVLPYFVAACRTGVGLAWKSGIAAEVIGLPDGTIGERLYQAKIFLATGDVLAWTVVVVIVAHMCERLIVHGLDLLERRLSDTSAVADTVRA